MLWNILVAKHVGFLTSQGVWQQKVADMCALIAILEKTNSLINLRESQRTSN